MAASRRSEVSACLWKCIMDTYRDIDKENDWLFHKTTEIKKGDLFGKSMWIAKNYPQKCNAVTDTIELQKLASWYYRQPEETDPTKWWGLLTNASEVEKGRHVLYAVAARWHRPTIIGNIIYVEERPAVIQDRSRFIQLN